MCFRYTPFVLPNTFTSIIGKYPMILTYCIPNHVDSLQFTQSRIDQPLVLIQSYSWYFVITTKCFRRRKKYFLKWLDFSYHFTISRPYVTFSISWIKSDPTLSTPVRTHYYVISSKLHTY